ncbi:hypothetical protein SmJEL517_g04319 [Synchytrium microbalum]|uniref:Origin recognition complex subunit 3 n=1 Tax=Synchytrium microbalum TaxID=1806994 RepID=A0A507C0J8_9FUNG|nr:uncharacterized protein SmJEL517_g04319 [Synchytrium microbalum]TPX32579.1 hypothetical protein SmJEL517_g04319 [Synchytrium microbalum]
MSLLDSLTGSKLVLPKEGANEIELDENGTCCKVIPPAHPYINFICYLTPDDVAIGLEMDGMYALPGEIEENVNYRHAQYHARWKNVNEKIQEVILTMNQQSLAKILDFVAHAHPSVGQEPRPLQVRKVTTVTSLIFSGINIPDQETLIGSLATQLQEAKERVAIMWSRNCSSLKGTLRSLIQKLVGDFDDGDEEMGDANDEDNDMIEINTSVHKRALCADDMRRLTGWYEHMKDKQPDALPGSLVVLMPDMECFDPQILADLIFICREYIDRLPFVLLIGVATSVDALHQLLPKSAISLLSTETFKLQLSENCLDGIVEEIFMKSASGLKLGAQVYDYLLAKFDHYDLCVGEFVRGIQYSHMRHYFGEPLSLLTDLTVDVEGYQDVLDSLQDVHYDRIRSLKSFQRHHQAMIEKDVEKAEALLRDNVALQAEVAALLNEFQSYHARYLAALECISSMQSVLKSALVKYSKRRRYNMGLKSNLPDADHVKAMVEAIRTLTFSDAKTLLKLCIDALDLTVESAQSTPFEKATLETFLKDLEQYSDSEQGRGSTSRPATASRSVYTTHAGRASQVVVGNTAYVSQNDIKKIMTASLSTRKTKVSTQLKPIDYDLIEKVDEDTWEGYLFDLSKFFRNFFKEALRTYTSIPLYEIMYSSNSKVLERAFSPQTRTSVQSALTISKRYLDCECCQDLDPRDPHPSLEDTQIAYRLYLECGKFINLYDWYVAFRTILERDGVWLKVVGGTEDGSPGQLEVHARFVRAVDELKLLGFIKQSGRKKDHVARLTW